MSGSPAQELGGEKWDYHCDNHRCVDSHFGIFSNPKIFFYRK
jgi:hypothetical protein